MVSCIWEQRGVLIVLRLLFRLLDYLWPKERDLIVFLGRRQIGYSDNSRHLFEKFLHVYGDEFSVLWITPDEGMLRDDSIEKRIRDNMVYQYSARGFIALLRAGTVFLSWGSSGLPGADFSRRTIVIQLWHGIPIKRINLCQKGLSKRQAVSAARELRKIDYWICSSKVERNAVALCTGLPIDDVKITGYPRNDYLVEHRDSGDPRLLTLYPYLRKKVILYAPTWRPDNKIRFFPFDDFSIDELTAFLERNDAYLVLRAHYANDTLALGGGVDYEPYRGRRIFVLNRDSLRDVQDILPFVDILISDYSGIWVDFLLLDRPIVFIPYDLSIYENNPGMLYDYDCITPGPKVSLFREWINEVEAYFLTPSRDSTMRRHIMHMFHEHDDGLAYKRIYELVKSAAHGRK